MFQALLSFAQQSHRPLGSHAYPELAVGCQRIPTGLVLAGGVNSADHGRTFPSLADFMRQQGCYVALLKPEHFTRGPGETAGEVLRQFSGLADSRAEHFAALKAWYEDEAGSVEELAQQAQQAQQADQQEQQAEAGGGGKGDGRALRQRPAPAEQAAEAALAAEQAANRQRPLVVIVEGTEGVDVQCLRDFILVASEVSRGWCWFGWLFVVVFAAAGAYVSGLNAAANCRALHCTAAVALPRLASGVPAAMPACSTVRQSAACPYLPAAPCSPTLRCRSRLRWA